ncbi:MAG TPA: efflux RND transporter permease subunit [Prolixibacteraceae bacterium]|nr:efflux RND transporter permease subunit [Prolixibacteraceae bacterium]
MFTKLSRIILRNRILLIVLISAFTVFMAFEAQNVKLSYENSSLLSQKDSAMIEYQDFKKQYGEDGNVLMIGIKTPGIFQLEQFNAFYDLGDSIRAIDGVQDVISMTRGINLIKNKSTHQFDYFPLVKKRPNTQQEVDSLKNTILGLKFYEGILYNPKTNAALIAITLDKNKLNDRSRIKLVANIVKTGTNYQKKNNVEIHYSGMPYIRTITMQKVKQELFIFVLMSMAIAALIMLLFFKSMKVVLSSLLIVGISIVWVLGTTVSFNFKITILTGVIPSLIIIIAIENCIYILNKYHWEYRSHGNKIKALIRVVQRIGFASLMTNAATALGFAAFILIPNQMLREFGIITALNIMLEYVLCILLLPIIFSFIDPPTAKHVKHLDSNFFGAIIKKIIYLISYRRHFIYGIAAGLLLIGFLGISLMKTSGKIVDDFRKDDPIYLDLKFFENNFGGVMPFEISIDTKKKNGVMIGSTIDKINELQKMINTYPEFSKPLSIAELFKFSKQAYFGGDSSMYSMPNNVEKGFIMGYLPKHQKGMKTNLLYSYLDSTRQYTRVSFQMADIGTHHMDSLMAKIHPQIDSIFSPKKYNVKITGNSVVYARGTNFLIHNLFDSVLIAIVMISLLMALLFSSFRMILVSMIPNIIPLLITAAIMGYAGIPIKPSTIIVFSIALGISVDNAIQYLSRYRHELKVTKGDIKQSAINALHEAGFSMIYTSIVLVLGFSVFIVSSFGGTQALGILISTTLLIAMFFNMMVLPSLLLTLDKRLTSKDFIEPIVEIYDDEDLNEYDENPATEFDPEEPDQKN